MDSKKVFQGPEFGLSSILLDSFKIIHKNLGPREQNHSFTVLSHYEYDFYIFL